MKNILIIGFILVAMFGGNFTDETMGYIHHMLNPPWWVIAGTIGGLLLWVRQQ